MKHFSVLKKIHKDIEMCIKIPPPPPPPPISCYTVLSAFHCRMRNSLFSRKETYLPSNKCLRSITKHIYSTSSMAERPLHRWLNVHVAVVIIDPLRSKSKIMSSGFIIPKLSTISLISTPSPLIFPSAQSAYNNIIVYSCITFATNIKPKSNKSCCIKYTMASRYMQNFIIAWYRHFELNDEKEKNGSHFLQTKV